MQRRIFLKSAASVPFFWAAAESRAQGETPAATRLSDEVFFAGLAYFSKYEDTPKVLPSTCRVLANENGRLLDKQLVQLTRTTPCQVRIEDGLGRLEAGKSAYVMALAVDHEVTDIEQIAGQNKLSAALWGQLLVFDFHSKSVVSSIPIVSQFNDLFDRSVTEQDIDDAYRRLILGDDPGGLKQKFAIALGGPILPRNSSRSIRVTKSTISDRALQQIADLSMGSPGVYQGQVASRLSGWLSSNQKICVLPPDSSQAIGSKMAARLSNGDIYSLQIPQPDYEVHLNLDGFKKVLVSDVAAGRGFVYGAFVTIKVLEPLSGSVFFESQVKLGVKRTQPATESEINDGPVFDDALQELFSEFTAAVDPLDEEWARHNILPAEMAAASMKSLRKVIVSCR